MPANSISLSFSVDAAKKIFFKTDDLDKSFDAARKRILIRSGAIVRKIARNSIAVRKWSPVKDRKRAKPFVHDYLDLRCKTSEPGQPPNSHVDSGGFGIRTIFFAYDQRTDTVVIGPVGSRGSRVPETLEFGGVSVVSVPRWAQKRTGGRSRIRRRIAKRPFMAPALGQFKTAYPQLWRDAIKARAA